MVNSKRLNFWTSLVMSSLLNNGQWRDRARNRRRRFETRSQAESLEDRCLLATFTVLNTNDSGAGSLREAVSNANAISTADIIEFDAALAGSPILLTGNAISINRSLTINGLGATQTIIDGQQFRHVFTIQGGDVTLNDLTVRNGKAEQDRRGGGIHSNTTGTLTINRSTISGNSTLGQDASGGGLFAQNSNVTINDSLITGNSTTGDDGFGGGLHLINGTIIISNSTISGNSTNGQNSDGGGLFAGFGDITITGSTISGNSAVGAAADGGGIFIDTNLDPGSTLQTGRITNSTLSGNSATARGGGLYNEEGLTIIQNSTITANTASADNGSGVYSNTDRSSVPTRTEVSSSIIAGNTNSDVDSVTSGGSSVQSNNFNLIGTGTATSSFSGSGDQVIGTATPGLETLQNNGGLTQTHALLPGSPAIDAGSNTLSLAFDQRGSGFVRVVDGNVDSTATADVGAFEFAPPALTVAITEASISENGGTGRATVTRSGDTATALTVTLASNDTTEATVPATVTIAAGQATSAEFTITGVDDAVVDGDQTVTITASATGNVSGTDTIQVTDDDTATLTLTIAATSISEGDGTTATTATVSRNTDTTSALTVTLASDDTTEATVPATVTIAAGQTTSDAFNIAAVDDALVDGSQTVTVTASATGFTSGTDTVTVTDNETASLTVMIAASSISEAAGANATTATVTRDGATTAALTVTLTSSDTTEATVPTSVTIAAGQTTSAAFNITAVDDALVDGLQVVVVTASATGLTSGTGTLIVTDDEVASLTLAIAASSISEAAGANATTATVTRNGDTNSTLTVTLTSSDTTEATVPGTVTIAAGQTTSAAFNIAAVDDSDVDGTQTVSVTASATGFVSGTETLAVTDDDTAPTGFAVTAPINRTDSKRPLITWTPVAGALSYDVWVNRASLGGEPVVNLVKQLGLTASQASYQTNVDLELGVYRIYIYANMPGGSQQESAPHTFVVDERPVLTFLGATIDPKPTFTWSRVPGAASYVIFIGVAGGNVVESVPGPTSGTSVSYTLNATLPTNDFFWWVRPVRSNGFQGLWSEHSIVSTGGRTNLVSPARNSTITTTVPEFEWTAVPGATAYEVYVSKDGTPGALYRDPFITENRIRSRPLGNGDYRAWVRSTLADGSTVWGRPVNFTINEPSISLTTTPVAPAAPGFDATPTFTWQPTSGATTYDILLHRGTESRLVTSLTGTTYTPVTDLSNGTWTWSIRPVNASGAGAWSAPLTFATDGTTAFLTPVSPTSDTTPTFTWQPVTGATHYALVIFSGTSGNNQVFRDDNLTGTTVTPTTALPAGPYRVWVRAISGTTVGQWSLQFNLIITAVTPDGNDDSPDTLLASLSSLLPYTEAAATDTSTRQPTATRSPRPRSSTVVTKDTPKTIEMATTTEEAAIDDQFAEVTAWLSAM